MSGQVRAASLEMGWSRRCFVDLVWPVIREHPTWGGGRLIPAEGESTELAQALDVTAGVDYVQVLRLSGVDVARGIAARVQRDVAYNTFTVRATVGSGGPTEIHKRGAALSEPGYITPYLHVQAYVNTSAGELLSVGVCRVADLQGSIDDATPLLVAAGGNTFYVKAFMDVPGSWWWVPDGDAQCAQQVLSL